LCRFKLVLEIAILTVFPGAVAFAGAMDLFTLTIPNRVSLVLIAAFFLLAPLSGLSAVEIANHAGAALLTLAVSALLFVRGWLGGGDAKLVSAVALWLGFEHLLAYLLYVAVAGGVLAGLFLALRAVPLPAAIGRQAWAVRLHDSGGGIPYGVALAAGALLVYPHTHWCTGLAG
jgi:prepilin peptidase CpaA